MNRYQRARIMTCGCVHEDQLSRKHWGMDRFRIQALENILRQGDLKAEDYEAALAVMFKKIKVVLNGARKRDNHELISAYEAVLAEWSTKVE